MIRNLRNIRFLLVLTLLGIMPAFGQNASFNAPVDRNQAAVGEQLEVTFTLSASSGAKNFRAPVFKDFDILSGPNQSTNMQFINGAMSSSVSYAYVVSPRVEGKSVIGPASIEYTGKTLQTQSITIIVAKGTPHQQQTQQNGGDAGTDISRQIGDNLFLK